MVSWAEGTRRTRAIGPKRKLRPLSQVHGADRAVAVEGFRVTRFACFVQASYVLA